MHHNQKIETYLGFSLGLSAIFSLTCGVYMQRSCTDWVLFFEGKNHTEKIKQTFTLKRKVKPNLM